MDFGEVLSRSWHIIWKHKVLWIFGILAGLGSGGSSTGSGSGSSSNAAQFQFNGNNFGQNIPWYQVERWINANWWIFILLGLAVIAFIVVIVILSTFGRIGLARGAWQADDGAEKLGFGQLFGESGAYFWRVFGLVLLIILMWLVVMGVLFIPAAVISVLTLGIGLLCIGPLMILLCCLLIPIGWAVSVITEQAIVAITCEDLGVLDAVGRAWEVFRNNLGSMTIMFLILGIGGGIVRFIIAMPVFLISIPLIGAAIAGTNTAWMAGGAAALIMLCVYIPVALVFNGVVTSYTGSAWVVTFRRLTGRNLPAPTAEVVPAA